MAHHPPAPLMRHCTLCGNSALVRRLVLRLRHRHLIPGNNPVLAFNHTWRTLGEGFKDRPSRALAALLCSERCHIDDCGSDGAVDDLQLRVKVWRRHSSNTVSALRWSFRVAQDLEHVLERVSPSSAAFCAAVFTTFLSLGLLLRLPFCLPPVLERPF